MLEMKIDKFTRQINKELKELEKIMIIDDHYRVLRELDKYGIFKNEFEDSKNKLAFHIEINYMYDNLYYIYAYVAEDADWS